MDVRSWPALLLFVLPLSLYSQIQVRQIKVQGNQRLNEAAIVAASGLHLNAQVTPAELNAVAQKLFDTGLFTGVSYKYSPLSSGPGSGQAVTLIVTEEAAHSTVVLDIPGADPETLWKDLTGETSLIRRTIPASAAANAYYIGVIEAALAKAGRPEALATDDEGDLATGATTVIVRPLNRPAVADVTFTGNTAVPTPALRERILKLTAGRAFSEREYRRIIELNLRPLFEDKGLLSVTFPAVRTENAGDGKVTVACSIDEGRVWRLGNVRFEGEDLPTEEMLSQAHFEMRAVANWSKFLAASENAQTVLRHRGFLSVASEPVRAFRSDTGMVDITVVVRKGRQFRFASLEVNGLTDAGRSKAIALWKLKPGDAMDGPYVGEYARLIYTTLANGKKSVSSEMRVRGNTTDVDVIVSNK